MTYASRKQSAHAHNPRHGRQHCGSGQATTLDAKLKEVGAPHETILLEGVGHSFNLTHTWENSHLPNDLRPTVIGFFEEHLRPSK